MGRATVCAALLSVILCARQAHSQAAAAAPQPKNVTAAAATTIFAIRPPKLGVNVSFMIDGEMSTDKACANWTSTSTCQLAKLHATKSAVFINYGVLPAFSPNLTAHVLLKACYANSSQHDRPWRKTSPVIAKSKKCPITIKGGLPPEEDTGVKWVPNDLVATATYFVRAYVVRNATMNGTLTPTTYPVAFGDSGYFDVHGIDSRPTGMKAAAAVCSTVGPLMFGGYFALTYLRKSSAKV